MSDEDLNLEFGFDYGEEVVNVLLPVTTSDGKPLVKQFSLERWVPFWVADDTLQKSGEPFAAGSPAFGAEPNAEALADPDYWKSLDSAAIGLGESRQDAFEDMVCRNIAAMVSAANLMRETLRDAPLEDADH